MEATGYRTGALIGASGPCEQNGGPSPSGSSSGRMCWALWVPCPSPLAPPSISAVPLSGRNALLPLTAHTRDPVSEETLVGSLRAGSRARAESWTPQDGLSLLTPPRSIEGQHSKLPAPSLTRGQGLSRNDTAEFPSGVWQNFAPLWLPPHQILPLACATFPPTLVSAFGEPGWSYTEF